MIHLLKYFKTLSLRPENAKEIRALILELAIRGRLTEEWRRDHPDVEPADVLLERIREEKERLLFEGHIKKEKERPEITEKEIPFEIPRNWEFIKMGEICPNISSGSTPPKSEFKDDGVPYLKVYNIRNQKIDFEYKKQFVTQDFNSTKLKRSRLHPGDVVMNIVGPPLGKIAIIPNTHPEWNCNQAITFFKPVIKELNTWIYTYLLSKVFLRNMELIGTAGQDNISVTKSKNIVIPLPPLPEQKAIVATVNHLLAEVYELEQQTTRFQALRQDYVTASLRALTGEGSGEAWAALRPHFQAFFNQENGVKKLRAAILELAVQGKLTAGWRANNPDVESAGVLLERIGVEKARLLKEGKIKKEKELLSIQEKETPFDIPSTWLFSRMGQLCPNVSSGSTPPKSQFLTTGVPYLKVYNIRGQKINFDYKRQYVSEEYHSTKLKRSILRPGDVIMNIVGPPLGKVAIIPDSFPEWNCNQAITFFKPVDKALNNWLYTYLLSKIFLRKMELIGTAGQDNISVTKSKNIVVPLPPLSEQKAIVKIVDKLMALCDRLEGQIEEREAVGGDFLRASVRELLVATESKEV